MGDINLGKIINFCLGEMVLVMLAIYVDYFSFKYMLLFLVVKVVIINISVNKKNNNTRTQMKPTPIDNEVKKHLELNDDGNIRCVYVPNHDFDKIIKLCNGKCGITCNKIESLIQTINMNSQNGSLLQDRQYVQLSEKNKDWMSKIYTLSITTTAITQVIKKSINDEIDCNASDFEKISSLYLDIIHLRSRSSVIMCNVKSAICGSNDKIKFMSIVEKNREEYENQLYMIETSMKDEGCNVLFRYVVNLYLRIMIEEATLKVINNALMMFVLE